LLISLKMNKPSKLLVLIGSPRRAGNSATLAKAVQRGAEATGAEVSLRFVDDYVSSFLVSDQSETPHSQNLDVGAIWPKESH
jgi:multimeric flavodoxin WrbA